MADSSRMLEYMKDFQRSQRNKKFTTQQWAELYDNWAETYEQDMMAVNYRAPDLMVDFLKANFSGSREEARVLDVACGSGWVAKLMAELGFKHFVGVDSSQGMLDQAAQTGLYKDLRLALLGIDPLPAQTGAFDVVIIVGALRVDLVPISVVRELCHATKPGGYVCMSRVDPSVIEPNTYKERLEKELQLMEEEGLWTCVTTKGMGKYMTDYYGGDENQKDETYVSGTMYLYKKSLN